jgi:hypothetical protein
VHRSDGWRTVLEPVIIRYRGIVKHLYFRGDAAFANPEIYEFLKPRGSATRSGCQQIPCCRTESDICSSARSGDRHTRCAASTLVSAIRRRVGRSRAASWPRSSGLRASCTSASASSSAIWRGRLSASSPSTTSAAPASSSSRKERARSNGRGCHAGPLPPTPCVSSSTSLHITAARGATLLRHFQLSGTELE